MPWTAHAEFQRHSGTDFRVKTELRKDADAQRLIGVVLMINPGSSKGQRYDELGEATVDATMRAVVKVVEDGYQAASATIPKGAYIQISNLFDICEPHLRSALEKYRLHAGVKGSKAPIHCSIDSIPRNAPWIWIAWGSEAKDEDLEQVMHTALSKLSVPTIGVRIPSEKIGYYHPLFMQRTRKTKPSIREAVVGQLRDLLST